MRQGKKLAGDAPLPQVHICPVTSCQEDGGRLQHILPGPAQHSGDPVRCDLRDGCLVGEQPIRKCVRLNLAMAHVLGKSQRYGVQHGLVIKGTGPVRCHFQYHGSQNGWGMMLQSLFHLHP